MSYKEIINTKKGGWVEVASLPCRFVWLTASGVSTQLNKKKTNKKRDVYSVIYIIYIIFYIHKNTNVL